MVVYDASRIWRQSTVPVVFRDTVQRRVLVKLPYAPDNRAWLKGAHVRYPEWLKQFQCWQVPRAWLDEATSRLCLRYGQVYLIQPYRERETCAPACWNATGLECECSCLGAYHGENIHGASWYVVSETCALRWGPRQYGCRLLTASDMPLRLLQGGKAYA